MHFPVASKYLLPDLKASSKTVYLVAVAGGKKNVPMPLNLVVVRFMTKQNSIRPKALIMPLTLCNCV